MTLNLLNKQFGSSSFLNLLDWDKILKKIQFFSHFELTKESLVEQPFLENTEKIEESYLSLDFMTKAILDGEEERIQSSFLDLSQSLSTTQLVLKLKKGSILQLYELSQVANFIEQQSKLNKIFSDWNVYTSYPLLEDELKTIRRKFFEKIRTFVSKKGEIDYLKHPLLKELHLNLTNIEQSIRKTLKELVFQGEFKDIVRYDGHDLIDDHYVLAIHAGSYKGHLGSIIGRSDSGLTLYVEPVIIKEKSNQRMKILAKIDEIISRICQDYSELLQENLYTVTHIFSRILKVDFFY